MDHHPYPESHIKHNQSSSKNQKKRLSQEQVQLLESSFDATKKLEPELKFQLARELCVPPRQIAIWYQNKRARWKNQSLELDYGALQLRLEAALAENRDLEKEVFHLRAELKRAQDMLCGFRAAQGQAQSSCYEEGGGTGSSSLNDDVVECTGNWVDGQLDEMYACFMMAKDSSPAQTTAVLNNQRDFWL